MIKGYAGSTSRVQFQCPADHLYKNISLIGFLGHPFPLVFHTTISLPLYTVSLGIYKPWVVKQSGNTKKQKPSAEIHFNVMQALASFSKSQLI
jgi:hypothetical protein